MLLFESYFNASTISNSKSGIKVKNPDISFKLFNVYKTLGQLIFEIIQACEY